MLFIGEMIEIEGFIIPRLCYAMFEEAIIENGEEFLFFYNFPKFVYLSDDIIWIRIKVFKEIPLM